jgi:hypothetical protein
MCGSSKESRWIRGSQVARTDRHRLSLPESLFNVAFLASNYPYDGMSLLLLKSWVDITQRGCAIATR